VFDSKEESETKALQFVLSFAQSSEHVKTPRHYVQHIETTIPATTHVLASPKSNSSSQRRNRKACFVCKSVDHLIKDYDYHTKKIAQPTSRTYAHRGHHKQCDLLPHSTPQKHMVPTAVLTQSKLVSNTAVRPISVALPNITVTRPRHAHQVVTKFKSPIGRHITCSPSSRTINSPSRVTAVQTLVVGAAQSKHETWGNPQQALKDKGVIDSGCSRHMTGNMSFLSDFEELNGGHVAFGGNPKGGKITGNGKIKTGKLDFDDVYFVKELKFNLFSVSQMCDKKNSVLFTDTECLVLSFDFKLPDESQVLLRVPKENNIFTWVFFLATKDETTPILKTFITGLKNQLSLKVKVIESDNGTEFKNSDRNQFCGLKGIKREFSVPRTPQQNGIAERKNQTVIEAARTMLADSLLPIPFWAEEVNTAYYVQNRVLVTKPHNKTPYELLHGRTPSIGFIRPFGCPVTILNTLDPLGKFQRKVDEGFLVGYSVCSKAFRVFNSRTRIIQETLHVNFLENKPNVVDTEDAAFDGKEHDFDVKKPESKVILSLTRYRDLNAEFEDCSENSSNEVNAASSIVPTVGQNSINNTNTFSVSEDIIYSNNKDVVGAEADFNNMESSIPVSRIPTLRIYKDHYVSQIIGDLSSTTQTRSMTKAVKDQGGLSQMFGNDFHTCMFACFLSQKEPKRVHQALKILVGLKPLARIEAIRLFLAYASFMGFMVYQMDVKSAFLYGTIEKEVYVCQPRGFEDPDYPDKVYKVVKTLYGLHQAPRAWHIQVSDGLGPQKKLIFFPSVQGNPRMDLQDKGVIDSGCSRHMTGNMSYLTDYKEIDEGYVAFGGNPKGGKITRKGIKASDNAGQARKETEPTRFLFDIDALTRTMNYEPIVKSTQSNGLADPKSSHDDGSKPSSDDEKKVNEDPRKESKCKD
nr:putative ribonuclease H-like domain-containing protein [Tanacetum cinerariifolium]